MNLFVFHGLAVFNYCSHLARESGPVRQRRAVKAPYLSDFMRAMTAILFGVAAFKIVYEYIHVVLPL